MVYKGLNIRSNTDILKPLSVVELYKIITEPQSDLERMIYTLRTVRSVDEKKYQSLKIQLPYIVCGCFNPLLRKTENFAHISYFVIDIDHISSANIDLLTLKSRLIQDSRVVLCYISPSNDGLKLLFKLKERCYDSGLFQVFYKKFAQSFANTHSLQDIIDCKTSDVTRACFLSSDVKAYYNSNADVVELDSFIDVNNLCELFDTKREIDKEEKNNKPQTQFVNKEPDKNAIDEIKNVLGLLKEKKVKSDVYVPEQLNQIIDDLRKFLTELKIEVLEITDINYGKKIKVRVDNKYAECNLFYGRRGYSVVVSPRRGTDKELNELIQELLINYLK